MSTTPTNNEKGVENNDLERQFKDRASAEGIDEHIFKRVLLSLWIHLFSSYPETLEKVKQLVKNVKSTFPIMSFEKTIRFFGDDPGDSCLKEILIISDFSMDEQAGPNIGDFRSCVSDIREVISEFESSPDTDQNSSWGNKTTTMKQVYTKTVEVPAWFLSAFENYQNNANQKDYFETACDLREFLNNFTFVVPIKHVELGQNLDSAIKDAANRRKIHNYNVQIMGLRTCLMNMDATNPENSEKIDSVSKEILFLEERRRMLQERIVMVPCMMAPDELGVVVEGRGNTQIETQVEDPISTMVPIGQDGNFVELTQSDHVYDQTNMTNRWLTGATVKLDRTIRAGEVIYELHLPYDLLKLNWQSSAASLFKTFEYWRGGMEIEVYLNIPKSNQVVLAGGVVYHLLQRDRPEEIQTPQTVTSQTGFILNGHMNASARMDIDFLSYTAINPVRENDFTMNLYIATLTIVALTDYEVADGALDTANLRIAMAFKPDLKFYGMTTAISAFPDNADIEFYKSNKKTKASVKQIEKIRKCQVPSMLKVAGLAGAAVLGKKAGEIVGGVADRVLDPLLNHRATSKDNRRNYAKKENNANSSLYQRTTPNIASGSCEFSSETFRLVSEAETYHSKALFPDDVVGDLKTICETFGFVTSTRLKVSDVIGHRIFEMKIQPAQAVPFVNGSLRGNDTSNWCPLDHIAGWYANYSGKQQIKLIIGSDGFKTFRIRAVFSVVRDVARNHASDTYNVIINIDPSLDTPLTHTIDVPYIMSQFAIPMAITPNELLNSGTFHLEVETPISQPMGGVDHVDIMILKRAMPGQFSLSVPTPNRSSVLTTSTLQRGYLRYSVSLGNLTTLSVLNFDGELISSDDFPLAVAPRTFNIVGIDKLNTADGVYRWTRTVGSSVLVTDVTGTTFPSTAHFSTRFLTGIKNASITTGVIATVPIEWIGNPAVVLVAVAADTTTTSTTTTSAPTTKVGGRFKREEREVHTPAMNTQEDHRHAAPNSTELTGQSHPVDNGLYGESHMHYEDILRRHEIFIETPDITIDATASFVKVYTIPCNSGNALFRDILPWGWRNNKLAHLHDAFRFYRGDLNYLIGINSTEKGLFQYRHVPQAADIPFTYDDQLREDVLDWGGYGLALHAIDQNVTMPIHVPMYVPGPGVLTCSYLSTERMVDLAKSNGVIEIFYKGPTTTANFSVYRAIANDFSFYCFNGFPERQQSFETKDVRYRKKRHIPAMFSGFSKAAEGLGTINYDLFNEAIASVKVAADGVSQTTKKSSDFLNGLAGTEEGSKQVATILLQVAQVINNPTPLVAALAISQVLVSFNILKHLAIETIQTKLQKLFSRTEGKQTPAMSFIDETAEIGATIFSAVTSYFGVTAKMNFTERMAVTFARTATMYDKVLKMLKKILKFVLRCVKYLINYFFPDCKVLDWIETDACADWINASSIMADDTVFNNIRNSPDAIALLFQLISEGEEMQLNLTGSGSDIKMINIVATRLRALYHVRTKLAKEITIPLVKYAPYVLYLAGKSHIGKSKLGEHMTEELKNDIPRLHPNVHANGGVFTVPMNKYWDQYTGEEIIIFDDFLRCQSNDLEDSEVSRFVDICGSAMCVVPKADIESKGMVSMAKLVVMCSNYTYPTVNGILDDVIQNRRHGTWFVELNEVGSSLPACEQHIKSATKMQFSCPNCLAQPGTIEILRKFDHLQMSLMDNAQSSGAKVLAGPMNYDAFLRIVRKDMQSHKENATANYIHSLRKKLNLGPDEDVMEYVLPNKPFVDFKKTVDKAVASKVLQELGGCAPGILQRPAMLHKFVERFMKTNKYVTEDPEEEELTYEQLLSMSDYGRSLCQSGECLHTDALTSLATLVAEKQIEPEEVARKFGFCYDGSHKLMFIDPELNAATWLNSKEPCCAECKYNGDEYTTMKVANLHALTEFLLLNGCQIDYAPIRYVRPQYHLTVAKMKADLHQKEVIKKVRRLRETIGVVLAVAIPAAMYIGVMVYANKTVDKVMKHQQLEAEKALISKVKTQLMPAAMFGAVKNESGGGSAAPMKKMMPRRRVNLRRARKAKPAMATGDSLLEKYRRCVLELKFKGKIYASAVCVSEKTYYTQAHAMYSLLHEWTEAFKKALDQCKFESLSPEEQGRKLGFLHAEHRISFEMYTRSGSINKVDIDMRSFLRMNNNTLLFLSDTDGCIFALDNENLKPIGLWDDIQSETKSVTMDNFAIMRYRGGKWFEAKDASNVIFVENDDISYKASDCPWSTEQDMDKEGYVEFCLDGFRCKNDYGEDANVMCGSILVDKTTMKIVGVMSAATEDTLWFNAITQENLQHYGVCHNISQILVEKSSKIVQVPAATASNTYMVSPPARIYHCTKTLFEPTPIHGMVMETFRHPARIEVDKDKGVGSFERAIEKYVPHKDFDFDLTDIYDDVCEQISNGCTDLPFVDVRSFTESVQGIEGKVKGIDLTTSPSYPFCTIPNLKTKKDLFSFNEEGKLIGVHSDLVDIMRKEKEMMKKKQDVPTIFQISHKAELLANPDKVRMIQGSPISLSLHMRQFFMDFNYMFQYDRMNLEHAVGMNVYGLEWDTMTRKLLSNGRHLLVGDYSKFGPRLYSRFVEKAYDFMIEWYERRGASEENNAIRRELAKRVVRSLNMAYDQVFQVNCGSPSGAINTVIINSICNMLYFRTAYKGIMSRKKPELAGMHSYHDFVQLFVVGDDVIASVHEDIIEYFNNQSIHEFFAGYDISYTDVIKDGEIRKWCTIHEATFLKEGFKLYRDTSLVGGIWICQPSLSGVKDITNWIRKPKGLLNKDARAKEEMKATIINCETSLRMSWFFGREYFNQYRKELNRIIKDTFGDENRMTIYTFDGLQVELGIPLKGKNEPISATIIADRLGVEDFLTNF